MGNLRSAAASAAKGALGMGALPLVRNALDRRAESGQLKKYLTQEHAGDFAPNPGAFADAARPVSGLSR
jgi:hypothetical protein